MINLDKNQILKALPLISVGLRKYLWIQEEFEKRDVAKDAEFQRKFNGFYKIIFRGKDWRNCYYNLLQKSKKEEILLGDVMDYLKKETGRVEASFSSKFIATKNPNLPVIDKIVFENLTMKLPMKGDYDDRKKIISNQYNILKKEFDDFLKKENGLFLVEQFKKAYPEAKISNVKMLDFVLWQTRESKK